MNQTIEQHPARRPFLAQTCTRPGVIDALLRRQSTENAFVEINNLLASAASVRDVTPLDVLRVCEEHRVDPIGPISERLEKLYGDYLCWCLRDRHLSHTESCDLAHLRAVLRVSDSSAAAMHEAAAEMLFGRSVDAVLGDCRVPEPERCFLAALHHG